MTTELAIFDLDDTLFDHLHGCRCVIEAIREQFPVLASSPMDELLARDYGLLDEWHLKVLPGAETIQSARRKRHQAFQPPGRDRTFGVLPARVLEIPARS